MNSRFETSKKSLLCNAKLQPSSLTPSHSDKEIIESGSTVLPQRGPDSTGDGYSEKGTTQDQLHDHASVR